jgi:cyclase
MRTIPPLAVASIRTARAVLLVAACLFCSSVAAVRASDPASAGEPAGAAAKSFRVESLAEGVLLFRPGSAQPERTNSLVIELDSGLLVVGAQPSAEAAQALLGELGKRFETDPRFLVLPSPHADAAGGAAAFPDSTLIIATQGYRSDVSDPQFDFGAEARLRRGAAAWTEPARVSPALVLSGQTIVDDPHRPVELLPLPPAHTGGDLIVKLPQQNILFAGAVAPMDRNPFGRDASVGGWLGAMNVIAKSRPAIVVPLRGEPVSSRELRLVRDSFAWLRGQVDRGFIDGLNAERITDWILESEELAEHFDAGADPSFLRGLVEQAVREAVAWRKKRGIE